LVRAWLAHGRKCSERRHPLTDGRGFKKRV
jgi:hypothetical protein